MANDLAVNFNIKGVNRVRNQLRALASAHPDVTDPVIEKHAKSESARLRKKPYPPYLPHFRHTRTQRLGKSFRAQHVKPGHWRVINRTPYAPWVIKKATQRKHPSFARWWTIEDVVQAEMPKLTAALSEALTDLMEKQPD